MEGFFKIVLNFDLAGGITCRACCFSKPALLFLSFFLFEKGDKKTHSHKLARPAYVRDKLIWVNTERSIKRGVGGQMKGEIQRDGGRY